MKDTEFVVNAFRKGMTENEMHGFAVMIKEQYDDGYAHHEGFDAGDLAIVVMKRDVDESQSQPSGIEQAAQALNTALQQANQTIEYLRNEIDSLRKMNAGQSVNINAVSGSSLAESYNDLRRRLKGVEHQIANEGNAGLRVHVASERLKTALEGLNAKPEMMTVEDAKTLANVAYNRAKHLPCEGCTQQDFESWWTEYIKENGFVNEQPELYHPESIDAVYEKLKGMASRILRWTDFGKYNVRQSEPDFEKFNTAVHQELGFTMDADFHRTSELKISFGTPRAGYLNWMASQIYTQLTTVKKPEPTPTDSVFEGIMSELKEIARGAMGWSEFENATTPDGNFDAFWRALEKRYDSVPSGDTIYIKGTQLEYLESIAKAIIVLNPKRFAPKPKAIPTRAEVAQTIKDLAAKHFGWHAHGWGNPFYLEPRAKRVEFKEDLREELGEKLRSVKMLGNFIGTRFQWVQQLENQIMAALEAQP